MLNSIFHAGTFLLESVALTLATSLVLGIVISLLYKRSCAHTSYFSIILAILPLLVSAVIMIVNGNLGTSVAVLGAFGLIRFRSVPGSAREIGFIFFAMTVGLAAGMGFLTLAALIALFAGAAIFLLEKSQFADTPSRRRELRVTIPEDLSYTGLFDDLFLIYADHPQLERVRTTDMGTMYELTYFLEMKDMEKEKEFIDALRCRNGNLPIVLGLVQHTGNEL